mmetsp:Transcript_2055/g.8014  ORF Transcript_2055/g.8014 Transcript_2055/m.8014 type:complete len:234 (-) Transcript_2055:1744-2445(-)
MAVLAVAGCCTSTWTFTKGTASSATWDGIRGWPLWTRSTPASFRAMPPQQHAQLWRSGALGSSTAPGMEETGSSSGCGLSCRGCWQPSTRTWCCTTQGPTCWWATLWAGWTCQRVQSASATRSCSAAAASALAGARRRPHSARAPRARGCSGLVGGGGALLPWRCRGATRQRRRAWWPAPLPRWTRSWALWRRPRRARRLPARSTAVADVSARGGGGDSGARLCVQIGCAAPR